MQNLFEQDKPMVGGYDTETTGLHIIYDKPFLIQFGWLVPKQNFGRVFTFSPLPQYMQVFLKLAKKLKYFVAHNIKYDLHMITNIGYGKDVLQMKNIVDNMAVARLALEAVPERDGGDSLKLKQLGVKYVHPDASKSESLIHEELEKLRNANVRVLAAALKQFPIEEEITETGRQKYWGKGAIEKFLKDPTNEVDDLPEDVREVWVDWQKDYPSPTYADVPRDIMIRYGSEDVITMLEFFKKAFKTLVERKQLKVLALEQKCILPLYKMERVGLKVDRPYLLEAKQKVKGYIIKLRNEMKELTEETFTVGQHDKIKKIFDKKWGIVLDSANKKAMDEVKANFEGEPKRLATLIISLRSLEKWYATYIKRILESSKYDGKSYTQINAYGAVSGRMSCDWQQMPKDALYDLEGNELFHPRKAVIVDKEQFDLNAYCDFSQVELRTTADYTIKVSGGDVNLTRAYMPFQCHREGGIPYEFKTVEKRKEWNQYDWYLNEEPTKKWEPTDMHAETTHNALMYLGYTCHVKYEQYQANEYVLELDKKAYKDVDKKAFKSLRSKLGKRFNFSKTYGVGLVTTMNNLNVSEKVAKALINGYETAFPGIITYQKAIEYQHHKKGYVHNAYGMRYYLQDGSQSYKLANYVIQGSCAYALKEAIIKLDEFITENNLKTKMILPVHDEIIFGVTESEKKYIPKFVEIMQSVFDSWCLVPIVSEPEITYTRWAEKQEYIS